MIDIAPVRATQFRADAVERERTLVITLGGNADVSIKSELDRFLIAVHDHAQRARLPRVHVDVRPLTYMSAACLNSLFGWLSHIEREPIERRYAVRFSYDPEVLWQRRRLRLLSQLAAELVTLDT